MNRLHFLLAASAALLAACGGDPGQASAEAPPAANEVPAEANASSTAFVAWMDRQPESDTREPLGVDGAMPPTSETDEPVPLR
jgi:hypothetical protein